MAYWSNHNCYYYWKWLLFSIEVSSTESVGFDHRHRSLLTSSLCDLHLRKVELSYHMNRTCCSFSSLWRAIWYLNIFREIRGRDDNEDSSIRGKDFGVNRNAHMSLTESILENVLKNCGSSFTKTRSVSTGHPFCSWRRLSFSRRSTSGFWKVLEC